jgi:hypothetical protein
VATFDPDPLGTPVNGFDRAVAQFVEQAEHDDRVALHAPGAADVF